MTAPLAFGVVLAGGASRRMGSDKALLVHEGTRLVDHAVATLAACCAEVAVASGARPLPDLAVPELADPVPGVGPLGGVLGGLEAAGTGLVAVLAVDMPHASAAVMAALAAAWAGEAVVLPIVGGRAHPLHAVWDATAAPRLRRLLAEGLHGAVAVTGRLGARAAGPEIWAAADPSGRFAENWNTPADE